MSNRELIYVIFALGIALFAVLVYFEVIILKSG